MRKSIPFKLILPFLLSFSFLILTSCIDQSSSRKGRPYIDDFLNYPPVITDLCTKLVYLEEESCFDSCPAKNHLGTNAEVDEHLSELVRDNQSITNLEEELNKIINAASGVCIKDKIVRPDQQLFINEYCGCLLNKPYIVNNCENFCATKNAQNPTLYGEVEVGVDIKLNPKLGNLYNWCKVEIDDGRVSPDCLLQIKTNENSYNVQLDLTPGSNKFVADLSLLTKDTTYTAKIIEQTSEASSLSIQLRRVSDAPSPPENILKITHVSQYTCVNRIGLIANGDDYFDNASKHHYYYPINNKPDPINANNGYLFCHDINSFGSIDKITTPRLENVASQFTLWEQRDARFHDLDGNKKLDINDDIERELDNNSEIHIFQPFTYKTNPEQEIKLLGFYMQPWIDKQTQIPYCPTETHYTGGDKVFEILKKKIGGDTEAVYFSKREPVFLKDRLDNYIPAPEDVIVIRESDLKRVWFYIENGVKKTPNQVQAGQKTIRFFYPFDFNTPLTRKPGQLIYTIFHPSNFNPELPRQYQVPSDRRVGCIPILK